MEIKNSFKKSLSKNLYCYKVDIRDQKSVEKLHFNLRKNDLLIDILINNAAIDTKVNADGDIVDGNELENLSVENWNSEISVGLTGTFLCCKVFGEFMASHIGGVILNIASDLSIISPDQRLYEVEGIPSNEQPVKPITYSVIKHGLVGLTKYLATYWKDSNVRCNALSPGGVYNGQPENFVKLLSSRIPMGRMANIDEYKASVIYLCSDASLYDRSKYSYR